jgi:hypothetical protein
MNPPLLLSAMKIRTLRSMHAVPSQCNRVFTLIQIRCDQFLEQFSSQLEALQVSCLDWKAQWV